MKEIWNILKQFKAIIFLVICLLAFQASLDLKLPDYTANIINVGIQERGIERSIPKVMRKNIFDLVVSVTTEKEMIKNSYELKSKDDFSEEELEKIVGNYPLIQEESLYFLKELPESETSHLEIVMTKDFLFAAILYGNLGEMSNFYEMQLPEGIKMIDVYQNLSESEKQKFYQNFSKSISLYESSMIDQIATEYVALEYQVIGVDLENIQMSYIIQTGLTMLGLALLLMIVAISIGFLASRTATKFGYILRSKVVEKIMSFSSQEFSEFSVASLITRSTNDIQQIQVMFVMLLRVLIYAPILGLGALFKVISNSMNWVLALGIACILVIMILLFIFVIPKFKMIQKLFDRLNLVIRERLTGVPVIRAFGTAKYEEKRFDEANTTLTNVIQFCDRVMGILMPTISFIMNGIAILIVWVGSKEIDLGTLQVGTLMAFITYSMQVIMSFLMISMVSVMLPRALVSIKRIVEILNKKNSIIEKDNPISFGKLKGEVVFENVSFEYPEASEKVLKNISFKASKGTTTAFIGSTGSGKSTLINLIPRFFDVTEGAIYVDGVDIRDVSLKDLRDKIGYVPQKGNLFSGTIASNITFGLDESNEQIIEKSCEVAQAADFIENFDEKYQYEISQGGTNVSGGQRQRLSIARAIAKNPEFYIFDDSFSALDFKTDANLRKALREYTKDATIFIVAQRISSIMNADQIIVLENGQMVGKGTHKKLMKNCQVYQEIALSQLKESELYE